MCLRYGIWSHDYNMYFFSIISCTYINALVYPDPLTKGVVEPCY